MSNSNKSNKNKDEQNHKIKNEKIGKKRSRTMSSKTTSKNIHQKKKNNVNNTNTRINKNVNNYNNNLEINKVMNDIEQVLSKNNINENINNNQEIINILQTLNNNKNHNCSNNDDYKTNFNSEFNFDIISSIETNDFSYRNNIISEQNISINENNFHRVSLQESEEYFENSGSYINIRHANTIDNNVGNVEFNRNKRYILLKIQIKDISKLEENKKKCVICVEDFQNGQDITYLPCSHIFHYECLLRIRVLKRCPLCRYDLEKYK